MIIIEIFDDGHAVINKKYIIDHAANRKDIVKYLFDEVPGGAV